MQMALDVNTELYPCAIGDDLNICLVSTVALDGSKDDPKSWREVADGKPTLADQYDYVCRGKVYRFDEGSGNDM